MTDDPNANPTRAALAGLRLWALATVIVCAAFMLHPARAEFYRRAWLFVERVVRLEERRS